MFSTWIPPRGCISEEMLDFRFEENTRLCTVRNYYWSERFVARNKTEESSDEPPTDQEHRPGD